MSSTAQGVHDIWPGGRPLLGMVHLLPLPGAPRWRGSMDEVVERAARDARALEEAGWDGVVVENFNDVPFRPGSVGPETVAALTRVVVAVRAVTAMPVGVNVLRNDAAAAVGACPSNRAGRVGSATAPDPMAARRRVALATRRSANDGDGTVPPQPSTSQVHIDMVVGTGRLRG